MRVIRIIGLLVAVSLVSASAMTPAFACPRGYAPCGGGCCPTR
jgi:hypothetical protein